MTKTREHWRWPIPLNASHAVTGWQWITDTLQSSPPMYHTRWHSDTNDCRWSLGASVLGPTDEGYFSAFSSSRSLRWYCSITNEHQWVCDFSYNCRRLRQKMIWRTLVLKVPSFTFTTPPSLLSNIQIPKANPSQIHKKTKASLIAATILYGQHQT